MSPSHKKNPKNPLLSNRIRKAFIFKKYEGNNSKVENKYWVG